MYMIQAIKKYVGLKYTITQATINNYINYYDFMVNVQK